MPAYIIAFVRFEDFDAYNREYLSRAHTIVTRHGGKAVIASDERRVLEGSLPPGRVVVVEFPSRAHAEAFYSDPEYRPLIAIRQRYTQSNSLLVEKGFEAEQ